jgi:hypothetical protein
MTDRFVTYLHDHLAGARFAIEVMEDLRNRLAGHPAAALARRLLPEVEADRQVLEELAQRCGDAGSALKEAAAWIAQKASRLKLRLGSDADFAAFESLEILSLGVQGKAALWRAMAVLPDTDKRRHGLDLDQLFGRALNQFDEVEKVRLELAKSVFRQSP